MAYEWQSDIIRPDGENGTEVLDTNGVYQPQIEGGDNITIEDGRINASGTLENVQANFGETNPNDPSYIKNKPDLSIYATASGMETALAGKQDVIEDLSTIRSGSEAGATAVQPGDLAAVATTGSYTSLTNTPQNIVQDASYVHTDNNFSNADKSKLDGIAAGAEVNIQPDWDEADSSSDAFIKNKPTIPAAQQNADWNASSGVTAILNKPDLSAYATDTELTDGLATKQDVISDLDTIRSGAAAGATAAQPSDLPSSDELVPSASSGDAGKVLTVDSQGEPQWVTPSGGTTYSAGDGIAIDGGNVISADVDGVTIGIDASTKKIKSLQTIPSVDQTYNAASTNPQSGTAVAGAIASISVDEVPAVTSSDDGKVLTASYSGGTGSYSWANSSVPSSKPLVAGSNITITDGANDVTIAADVDEVPAVTSSDDGKVLTASYSGGTGSYSWQTAQGGGSSEPTPLSEPAEGYNNLRFRFYDTSYDPSSVITGATWTRVSTNPNMWDCVFTSTNFFFNNQFTTSVVEVVDGYLRLSTATSGTGMFAGCTALKSVSVHLIIPSNTKTYALPYYFDGCNNLEHIRFYSTTATKGGINVPYMCRNCYVLKDVEYVGLSNDNSNTATLTIGSTCSNAFQNCYSLKSLDGFSWETGITRTASYMFQKCVCLKDLPKGLLAVGAASYMFQSCAALTHIGSIVIKNASGCTYMFEYCGGLQSVGYIQFASNVSGVNASYMFHGCFSLQSVVIGHSQSITKMESMFEGCTALLHLPAISYTNTTSVAKLYKDCIMLVDNTLDLYNTLSSIATITAYTKCFNSAGSDSIVGTTYLSQIPSSWGGTGE